MLKLNFKYFITESQVTDMQKSLLREIITNLIQNNKEWFNEKQIYVGDKKNFWILNYNDFGRNQYNKLVRGLVVRKPDNNWHGDPLELISSFPFTRFFNHQEKDAAPVDFNNAHMIEKLDGSMVAVHFPSGNISEPAFHTRRMHSSHTPDMMLKQKSFTTGEESRFLHIIKTYVDKLNFNKEDVENTYVFEFIHKISEVVTKYNEAQYGLYLIGGRNIKTFKEFSEEELNVIAKRIGSYRPRIFTTTKDMSEIQKMFKIASQETPDFEGFIFRDKNTGDRVKLKDPDYLKKHRTLGDLSFSALLPLYFDGETDEVVSYFPIAKTKVEKIDNSMKEYINTMQDKIIHYKKMNLTRKELASFFFSKTVGPKYLKQKTEPKVKEDSYNAAIILDYATNNDISLHEIEHDNFKNTLFNVLKNSYLNGDTSIFKIIELLKLES